MSLQMRGDFTHALPRDFSGSPRRSTAPRSRRSARPAGAFASSADHMFSALLAQVLPASVRRRLTLNQWRQLISQALLSVLTIGIVCYAAAAAMAVAPNCSGEACMNLLPDQLTKVSEDPCVVEKSTPMKNLAVFSLVFLSGGLVHSCKPIYSLPCL